MSGKILVRSKAFDHVYRQKCKGKPEARIDICPGIVEFFTLGRGSEHPKTRPTHTHTLVPENNIKINDQFFFS